VANAFPLTYTAPVNGIQIVARSAVTVIPCPALVTPK